MGENWKGCIDFRSLVGFLKKTIQKRVKIEKVASIYFPGLVSCKIFYMCKHLKRAKFLVAGKFVMCETFWTCEVVVVKNFWHVFQNLGRAKVLARGSKFVTCKSFGMCKKLGLAKVLTRAKTRAILRNHANWRITLAVFCGKTSSVPLITCTHKKLNESKVGLRLHLT